jgi:hypothetical protein
MTAEHIFMDILGNFLALGGMFGAVVFIGYYLIDRVL